MDIETLKIFLKIDNSLEDEVLRQQVEFAKKTIVNSIDHHRTYSQLVDIMPDLDMLLEQMVLDLYQNRDMQSDKQLVISQFWQFKLKQLKNIYDFDLNNGGDNNGTH